MAESIPNRERYRVALLAELLRRGSNLDDINPDPRDLDAAKAMLGQQAGSLGLTPGVALPVTPEQTSMPVGSDMFDPAQELPFDARMQMGLAREGLPRDPMRVAQNLGMEVRQLDSGPALYDPKTQKLYSFEDVLGAGPDVATNYGPAAVQAGLESALVRSPSARMQMLGGPAVAAATSFATDLYRDELRKHYDLPPVATTEMMMGNAARAGMIDAGFRAPGVAGGHLSGAREIRSRYDKELPRIQAERTELLANEMKKQQDAINEQTETVRKAQLQLNKTKERAEKVTQHKLLPEMAAEDISKALRMTPKRATEAEIAALPPMAKRRADLLTALQNMSRRVLGARHEGVESAAGLYGNRKIKEDLTIPLTRIAKLGGKDSEATQVVESILQDQAGPDVAMISRLLSKGKKGAFRPEDVNPTLIAGLRRSGQIPPQQTITVDYLLEKRQVLRELLENSPVPGDKRVAEAAIEEIDALIERTVPKKAGVGQARAEYGLARQQLGGDFRDKLYDVPTPEAWAETFIKRGKTKRQSLDIIRYMEPGERKQAKEAVAFYILGTQPNSGEVLERAAKADPDVLRELFGDSAYGRIDPWIKTHRALRVLKGKNLSVVQQRLQDPKWGKQFNIGVEEYMRGLTPQEHQRLVREAERVLADMSTPEEAAKRAVSDLPGPEEKAKDLAVHAASLTGIAERLAQWRLAQYVMTLATAGGAASYGAATGAISPTGFGLIGGGLLGTAIWRKSLENRNTADKFFRFATNSTQPRASGRAFGEVMFDLLTRDVPRAGRDVLSASMATAGRDTVPALPEQYERLVDPELFGGGNAPQ